MDVSTRNWVVSTIAGFVLLAVWIASIITPPVIALAAPLQAGILVLALGALGIQVAGGFSAVKTTTQLRNQSHL